MTDTSAAILVVEDESVLAMLLEDFLCDLGYPSPAVASTVEDALSLLAAQAFAFAILDINLGREQSFPVADVLEARGIAYFFMTGYGTAGVPDRLRHRYVLQKPYGPQALKDALSKVAMSAA